MIGHLRSHLDAVGSYDIFRRICRSPREHRLGKA